MNLKVNARKIIFKEQVKLSRKLSSPGKILVKVGTQVKPEDVVAEGVLSTGFRSLPLAKSLGVEPKIATKFLKVKAGDRIFPGEVLAKRQRLLWETTIKSPIEGTVGEYNIETGLLQIEFTTKREKLTAACWGKVSNIVDDLGVEIKTQVSKVLGVMGVGKVREGEFKILARPTDFLLPNLITLELKGKIIFGGARITRTALGKALSMGVSGIVAGGIHADDFFEAGGAKTAPYWASTDVGITLIILEGFGLKPVDSEIFKVLKDFDGKLILIDGNNAQILIPQFPDTGQKVGKAPEAVNNLPTEKVLAVGDRVRILDSANLGVTGQVVAISDKKKATKIGLTQYLVEIKTDSGTIIQPYTNLEVLL